jgi:hypothetical protein
MQAGTTVFVLSMAPIHYSGLLTAITFKKHLLLTILFSSYNTN